MRKFMVVVNERFLVMVEAENRDDAMLLLISDDFEGVDICEAFALEELGSERFAKLAQGCETVSLEALRA